jgi:hypothetical protein
VVPELQATCSAICGKPEDLVSKANAEGRDRATPQLSCDAGSVFHPFRVAGSIRDNNSLHTVGQNRFGVGIPPDWKHDCPARGQ